MRPSSKQKGPISTPADSSTSGPISADGWTRGTDAAPAAVTLLSSPTRITGPGIFLAAIVRVLAILHRFTSNPVFATGPEAQIYQLASL
jgi:hypothetical protein